MALWYAPMESALNLRTGKQIQADRADRRGQYLCPGCRVRVMLRHGSERVPHFYHKPRTPGEQKRAESCDFFCFSQGGTGQGLSAIGQRRGQLPVSPSLAIRWRERGQRQNWSLCVILPRPPTSIHFSHVRIQDYINGSDIPRQAISGTREFPVTVRSGSYKVGGMASDGCHVWDPQPTQVLHSDKPNIFVGGALGGVQLDDDAPLCRGTNYVVLAEKKYPWKPPVGVITQTLDGSSYSDPGNRWEVRLAYVPIGAGDEIEEWCARSLDRRLIDQPLRLEVMAPPIDAVSLEGVIELQGGSEIILSVSNETWLDPEPVIEWYDLTRKTSQAHQIEENPRFVSFGQLPTGRYAVYVHDRLDLDLFASLQFEIVPTGCPTPAPGVTLNTRDAQSKIDRTTDLLDVSAASHWAEILTRRVSLQKINLPPDWLASLRWQSRSGLEEIRAKLDEAALQNAIQQCLKSQPTYARLEAGTFGAVEWRAPVVTGPIPAFKKLPRDLLARIRWLQLVRLTMPHTGTGAGNLGIEKLGPCLTRTAYIDREPVAEFAAVTSWPLALLPQARAAALELLTCLRH